MLHTQHQPLTSLEEEESLEMSDIGNNAQSRHSWLLHSESESEDEENHAGLVATRLGKRNKSKKSPDPILISSLRKAWCCRLFFCCARETCQFAMVIAIMCFSFATFGMAYRSNTCWSARDELFLLNRFDMSAINGKLGPWPLKNAHSHNDYQQAKPLTEALLAGFCSVEGDVFLLNDILYLGHMVASTGTETLEGTYLRPLMDIVNSTDGFVFRRSLRLGVCQQVTLLVDIKSVETLLETWEALERDLKRLDVQLSDGRWVFETFDSSFNRIESDSSPLPSPLRVVVTGVVNNADEIARRMAARKEHKTSLDLNYESNNPSTVKAASWISEKWGFPFPDRNPDSLARTRNEVMSRVRFARKNGLAVRYWGTPENPDLWQFLLELGVDLINTDAIFTLHSFLVGRSVGPEATP